MLQLWLTLQAQMVLIFKSLREFLRHLHLNCWLCLKVPVPRSAAKNFSMTDYQSCPGPRPTPQSSWLVM